MKQQLVQRQVLERKLSQSLIQSIELLQFNSAELYDYIQDVTNENPLIEEVVYEGDSPPQTYAPADAVSFDTMNQAEQTLYDRLKEQLAMVALPNELRPVVEYGIDSLDESGYIDITLEEWSEACRTTVTVVKEALAKIQELEPVGIGARSLGECLYLQVRQMDGYLPYMKDLLLNRIEWIADANEEAICEAYTIDQTEFHAFMDMLKKCDPKPGSNLHTNQIEYIIPEAKIYKQENAWRIAFTHWRRPRFIINSFYNEVNEAQAKKFLIKKREQLNWLEGAIKYREATIERIIREILNKQIDFFERGIVYLQSMTLHEVAVELDIHLSTVSRAISNKYVETPHGVVDLKFFFQSGIDGNNGKRAAAAIQQLIYRLVQQENKEKPLSDESIKAILQEEYNLDISRRTVMKYRQKLSIPASYKRRRKE
jgi:RNA polymerase sigma-54 factor